MSSSKKSLNTPNNVIETSKFLNFLKISCQLNESINNVNRNSGDIQNIDYDSLANNEMIVLIENSKEPDCTTEINNNNNGSENGKDGENNKINVIDQKDKIRKRSLTKSRIEFFHNECVPYIHPMLSEKLDEVMNEGILDSVLPFVCLSSCPSMNKFTENGYQSKVKAKSGENPNNNLSKVSSMNPDQEKKDNISQEAVSNSRNSRHNEYNHNLKIRNSTKGPRRKSNGNFHTNLEEKKNETEIVIHVCDEIKNISKDFTCSQQLLVSKMGYFADVTAGQKLEDMDISVHCDIQIFEWLIKWVKAETEQLDNLPQLDAVNVVPILVSASFLQMESLLLDCLSFCHSRLNEVVRLSTNLSCLNDSIITRLSAMFTNLELEMVKDKKERVTPRLWIKMIQSLCEPEPQALRGHYFSLAGLFRCIKCGKYLTQSSSSYISCISSNVRLNRWGQIISKHSRDTSWQFTNYVGTLFKELKSWRKVYWKLWGHCHFLYCCICEMHFPVYQMNWCQYHPDIPQFLGPISEGKIAGPAGRYPCCGQQAFRYESLPGPNGCQYREHAVLIETDRDRAIMTLSQVASEGNCLYDPPPLKASVNHHDSEPRWAGISLIPTKCRQGLLPMLLAEVYHFRRTDFRDRLPPRRTKQQAMVCAMDSSSETDTSDNTQKKFTYWQTSASSDGCESECSSSPRQYRRNEHTTRQTKLNGGRYWSGEISARSNQDNQRDFEEKIMKQIISMVGKKTTMTTGNDVNIITNQLYQPGGGSYVRLESEWKEQLKQKNFTKQKTK